MAQGKVAQVISTPGGANVVIEKNPDLKGGKLGFFPIPGKTADTPGAVFTGGSDLVIPHRVGQAGGGAHLHQGTHR